MRKRIIKIYSIILLVGILYWLWGQLTGLYLDCFVRAATGVQCPACGISRMFLALLRLDFIGAFHYHPVIFCLFFLWNAVSVLCFWGKPKFLQKPRFLFSLLAVSVAAFVLFGIYRIFS